MIQSASGWVRKPYESELRRRLRAIASGACCFHANACRQRSSLTGRILHVAHEFEAKAKKQSRTGFGGCRVVFDDCERRIPSNHGAGAGYFACLAGQAASENNAYSPPSRPTRKDCPRRTRYGMPPDADPKKGSTVIFPANRPARSVENAITIS
jgi:hypothetical protein